MTEGLRLRRLPLLALGMLSLLTALWGGLARIGFTMPAPGASFATVHGPLMVCGFLGTLIALERAVALGKAWGYAAPLASGAAGVLLLTGASPPLAETLSLAAAAGLVAAFLVFLARQASSHTLLMAVGAACWAVGSALWLAGRDIPGVVPWWSAFLVLTIAGERLELSRLVLPPKVARTALLGISALYLAGVALATWRRDDGARVEGAGAVLLALWLARYDLARRTVRSAGLPRFIAVCLLSGYFWLAAHGALLLAWGDAPPGTRYDAVLHALFLGFVMSMIFGHAPVIFPSVLGARMAFSRAFYVHWAILHLSLAVRVGGDLAVCVPARQWGGLGNVAAILVFLAVTVASIVFAGARTESDR